MEIITQNNVTFNCSELGEWVVIYEESDIIEFGQFTEGRVQTMKNMFTANNEQACLDFIETNNLIFLEEE